MSSVRALWPTQTRRLDLIYFGMAFIDIVMISIALLVSYTTTTAFEAGVTNSTTIAARQAEVLRLTLLAQAIDAPPNDVFWSRDVASERQRLVSARAAFDAAFDRASASYDAVTVSARDREIVVVLDEVKEMADELYRFSEATIDHMEAGRATRASEAMSRADRIFGNLIERLDSAALLLEQVRAEHLQTQLNKTQEARGIELWIAVAVGFIVVMACIYGTQLARTLRQAESQHAQMLSEAAGARERMRRYADDVSHELRGPIAKMRLELEVLLGFERSGDEYRVGAEGALCDLERMSSIVDSLLFIARAENAPGCLTLAPLEIAREFQTLQDFYSGMAEQAGVSLEVAGAGSLYADRTLFQRAVANLISNAFGHTPSGGVVRVTSHSDQAETVVKVEDTGCGIEASFLERVFDRFQRGDASKGGAGLGLAIVKSIMTLHGGRAEIRSTLGVGTEVSLHFPHEGLSPTQGK